MRGLRDVMWGRLEQGAILFARAADLQARLDKSLLVALPEQLLAYEVAFGTAAVQDVLRNLLPHLEEFGDRSSVRWLKGCLSVNRAFQHYRAGENTKVPEEVARAIFNNPEYLANRGVLAILLRSMWRRYTPSVGG